METVLLGFIFLWNVVTISMVINTYMKMLDLDSYASVNTLDPTLELKYRERNTKQWYRMIDYTLITLLADLVVISFYFSR